MVRKTASYDTGQVSRSTMSANLSLNLTGIVRDFTQGQLQARKSGGRQVSLNVV
jgi:hypothetical protein